MTTFADAPASGLLADLPAFLYAGRVNCITGYGAAARHQLWALRHHGARFVVQDTGSAGDPDPHHESPLVQQARTSAASSDVPRASLIHVGPNCAAPWRRLPRPHVLVSVWETSRLPAAWVPLINDFTQVWCATEWQAQVYAASGVEPARVRYVPFALDPRLYPAEGPVLPELDALRRDGWTVFGAAFQWSERKAPRVLLGSYLAAFTRGEKVALVLKTYGGDDPATGVADRIAEIVRSYLPVGQAPRIEILSRRLSHNEMLSFYRGLDCYVASTRGEGFGLPIAEALLLGRPVIATDWSAHAEYARSCYHTLPYTLEVPHSMDTQPFYAVDQRWAAPDQDALVDALRLAHVGGIVCPHERVVSRFEALLARAGTAARSALADLVG